MESCLKKIGSAIVIILLVTELSHAQAYDEDFWQNPKVIWKTSSGTIITSTFAKKMHTQGNYGLLEKDLSGGRIEIKMVPPSKEPKKIPKNINWDDPNLIVKDENGQLIPAAMTHLLLRMNAFKWKLDTLETEALEVTFKLEPNQIRSAWDEPDLDFIKDWYDQWKNNPLPGFSLEDLNGEVVTNDIAKGKILVLNFWNTSCTKCSREFNQLNEVVEVFQNEDVVFLAPNYESSEMIRYFQQNKRLNYRILSSAQPLLDKLELEYYPSHIIVDQGGTIVDINVGGSRYIAQELAVKLSRMLTNPQ